MAKALSTAVILVVGVGTALGLQGGCSSGSESIGVHLSVDLVVERCPLVTSWKASPLQASAPNGAIDVAVTASVGALTASDGIDAGANALEYMWAATAGTFTDAGEPSTVYKCTTAGQQILTASVTDNHRRIPCADVVNMPVTCKAKAP
jgi:hypothetical protein